MCLVPQTLKQNVQDMINTEIAEQGHPLTDQIYSALAACLEGEESATRREAVAIHSAVLGAVLMFALADGLHDPLKHSKTELVDALIACMTVG